MSDRRVLYVTAFVRALATGMIGVLLGFYLSALHMDAPSIGLVAGAADRIGRRRTLVTLAALSAVGGLALLFTQHVGALAAAAFIGMVNGMGRDRGAALALEQAVLPSAVADNRRTMAFAAYNVAQDCGHALGGLLAAAPRLIQSWAGPGAPEDFGLRGAVALYVGLSVLPVLLY